MEQQVTIAECTPAGDAKALAEIDREYDYYVDQKFYLMETRDSMIKAQRSVTDVTRIIGEMTDRMVWLDERRNALYHIPEPKALAIQPVMKAPKVSKYRGFMSIQKRNEVVAWLASGEKYQTVADKFGVSLGTLCYHMKKLGIKKPRANSTKTLVNNLSQ